ncbi:MAG: hypothetical protein QXJ07_05700 [Candidatus Bathyarchaeia archaeon]
MTENKEEKFKQAFPETVKILDKQKEVTEVLKYLDVGIEPHDKVRKEHLIKILSFLSEKREGETKTTLSRLALRVGIDYCHLKRNYWDGLVAEGIIEVSPLSRGERWRWIGVPNK